MVDVGNLKQEKFFYLLVLDGFALKSQNEQQWSFSKDPNRIMRKPEHKCWFLQLEYLSIFLGHSIKNSNQKIQISTWIYFAAYHKLEIPARIHYSILAGLKIWIICR